MPLQRIYFGGTQGAHGHQEWGHAAQNEAERGEDQKRKSKKQQI
jgi:hypothetical protein